MVNNLSLVIEVLSLKLLLEDYNNTDLMNELQKQDSNYLEKIIKQNNEILHILKEVKNGSIKEN
jgi:hypothetical protein